MNNNLLLLGIILIFAFIIIYYLVSMFLIPKPAVFIGYDKFGIREIYPTKHGGEEWFMNMENPNNDPRTFKNPPMTQNADGSWKIYFNNNGNQQQIIPVQSSGNCCQDEVRYSVLTTSGYNTSKITINEQKLEKRGYMQSHNDWKNVEMTGYAKLISTTGSNFASTNGGWTWEARGARHVGDIPPDVCYGTSYNAHILWGTGDVRWEKEQWHAHIISTNYQSSPATSLGKFIGFKAIMYNIKLQDGKTGVNLEIWVDPNNDNVWNKVYQLVDSGGWGDAGQECGGKPDQIITWGGPLAIFRWDEATDVDIKDFSVREIQPQ
ncbi:MAG TPA: carbohydrate-binding protein [Verrucomicrobiae bacterium]|nr:carbohydrate-binding protein [Verrucomicrobiae bacterium]